MTISTGTDDNEHRYWWQWAQVRMTMSTGTDESCSRNAPCANVLILPPSNNIGYTEPSASCKADLSLSHIDENTAPTTKLMLWFSRTKCYWILCFRRIHCNCVEILCLLFTFQIHFFLQLNRLWISNCLTMSTGTNDNKHRY
jgi:hypothetical protein